MSNRNSRSVAKLTIVMLSTFVALTFALVRSRAITESKSNLSWLQEVPIGSKPKALAELANRKAASNSSVIRQESVDGKPRSEDLGNIEQFLRSGRSSARFTGVIYLFIVDTDGNNKALIFTYRSGRLVQRDWGHQPG